MAIEEIVDRLDTETTRRTVVKTGVKLAYAAPLVAATMKLSLQGASAAISATACTDPGVPAGHIGAACGGGEGCGCYTTVDGDTFCHQAGQYCAPAQACTTTSDCAQPGYACIAEPCSDHPICLRPCGVFADAAGEGATTGA